jgi:hypothetical protein
VWIVTCVGKLLFCCEGSRGCKGGGGGKVSFV